MRRKLNPAAPSCRFCADSTIAGCKPHPKHFMANVPELNVDDWRRIYQFMKHTYLPFMHQVIADAQDRERRKGA